ncbi:MAG: ABC transporter permease [Anaerolineaceae bacterium]|nr:ABC transporter permease [Anaerolineaceae bacterium]
MINYIIRRLLLSSVLALILVAIVFFLLRTVVPGDPVILLAGDHATPEMIEQIRINQGLDKPLYVQFFIFVKNALQGDLGNSIMSKQPVTDRVLDSYPVTIRLTLYSFLYTITLGVIIGIVTAYWQDTWLDNLVRVITVFGASIPTFWLGLMLILIFSVWLGWLPVMGDTTSLKGLLLPAISLGTGTAAFLARLVRASMLEVLNSDFVRTARAKGLHERGVVLKHALRNSLIPIITIAGFQIGGLLGGAVITENIFNLAGMGTLVIKGITNRDYPVIQGTVLFIAVTYLFVNLIVDVLYAYVDPRIRYD